MVEPDSIVRVLEGQTTLDLVGLDHGLENVAHRDRLALAGEMISVGENGAKVVRRVAPLSSQETVVVV